METLSMLWAPPASCILVENAIDCAWIGLVRTDEISVWGVCCQGGGRSEWRRVITERDKKRKKKRKKKKTKETVWSRTQLRAAGASGHQSIMPMVNLELAQQRATWLPTAEIHCRTLASHKYLPGCRKRLAYRSYRELAWKKIVSCLPFCMFKKYPNRSPCRNSTDGLIGDILGVIPARENIEY